MAQSMGFHPPTHHCMLLLFSFQVLWSENHLWKRSPGMEVFLPMFPPHVWMEVSPPMPVTFHVSAKWNAWWNDAFRWICSPHLVHHPPFFIMPESSCLPSIHPSSRYICGGMIIASRGGGDGVEPCLSEHVLFWMVCRYGNGSDASCRIIRWYYRAFMFDAIQLSIFLPFLPQK